MQVVSMEAFQVKIWRHGHKAPDFTHDSVESVQQASKRKREVAPADEKGQLPVVKKRKDRGKDEESQEEEEETKEMKDVSDSGNEERKDEVGQPGSSSPVNPTYTPVSPTSKRRCLSLEEADGSCCLLATDLNEGSPGARGAGAQGPEGILPRVQRVWAIGPLLEKPLAPFVDRD